METKKEAKKFYGIVGHATNPPDITRIKTILSYVGLDVKFWLFEATPVFLTRRDPREVARNEAYTQGREP